MFRIVQKYKFLAYSTSILQKNAIKTHIFFFAVTSSTTLKRCFSLLSPTLPALAPGLCGHSSPRCRSGCEIALQVAEGRHPLLAVFKLSETRRESDRTGLPSHDDCGGRHGRPSPTPDRSAPVPPAAILKNLCYSYIVKTPLFRPPHGHFVTPFLLS